MDVFAEFAFRYAVNRIARMRETHTFNTLTVQVVACDEARTRQLTATILYGTSPRGEQSSTTAVAKVQTKKSQEKIIEIGQEKLQQKG